MKKHSIIGDLKIIDLSTVLAGPSVGSFFAELGAEVMKIENPNHPDITRFWKLPDEDKDNPISAYFSSVNYNKQYLEIDYERESGKQELLSHLVEADMVIMNFKYGLQKRLGLADEVLRKMNPGLIIGKISGFGLESDRVAYDLILQAETGFMSMNGTPQSGPVKMPVALIDVLAAHHLKEGLLIELLTRSGNADYQGKTISVSLYDAAVSSLVNQAANYLMGEHIPKRIGSLHPNIAPYGELFKTADDKTITFAIGSQTHFRKLCKFLSLENLLTEPAYKSVQKRVENRKELYKELAPSVRRFTADEILKSMRKKSVPCGEIKDLKAVFDSGAANRLIREEEIADKQTQRVTSIAFQTN